MSPETRKETNPDGRNARGHGRPNTTNRDAPSGHSQTRGHASRLPAPRVPPTGAAKPAPAPGTTGMQLLSSQAPHSSSPASVGASPSPPPSASGPPPSWAALLGGTAPKELAAPSSPSPPPPIRENTSKSSPSIPTIEHEQKSSPSSSPAAVVDRSTKNDDTTTPQQQSNTNDDHKSTQTLPPIKLAPWAKVSSPVPTESPLPSSKDTATTSSSPPPPQGTKQATEVVISPTNSIRSPRAFSFQRSNGVVIVHDAPPLTTHPHPPPSPVVARAPAPSPPPPSSSTPPPSTTLSWAEKARSAALKAPPPQSPPSKAVTATSATSTRKSSAAENVVSPKGPGGKNSRGPRQEREFSKHSPAAAAAAAAANIGSGRGRKEQQHKKEHRPPRTNPLDRKDDLPHHHQDGPKHHVPRKPTLSKSSHTVLATAVVVDVRPSLAQPNGDQQPQPQQQPPTEPSYTPVSIASKPSPAKGTTERSASASSLPSIQQQQQQAVIPFEEALDILCASIPSVKVQESPVDGRCRFQPRGIKNPGNLCFVNAVLQGLMGSSSFCRVMLALRSIESALETKAYPVLAAMAAVGGEFERRSVQEATVTTTPTKDNRNGKSSASKSDAVTAVLGGYPMSSALVMELIHQFSPRQHDRQEGQVEQEDAHEFLHFLLEKMHNELIALRKDQGNGVGAEDTVGVSGGVSGDGNANDDDDGWLVQSGKKAVRQQEVSASSNEEQSIVSALFEGKFATSVACAGAPVSVTLHPFQIVEVPIFSSAIHTIEDALEAFTESEILEDYKPSGNAPPQRADKSERFQALPEILILHLMRFQFSGRSTKIQKHIGFEPRLTVRPSWMAAGCASKGGGGGSGGGGGAAYALVATVTHHGKTLTSGHYTADVVQPDNTWLRFDDSDVFVVGQQKVFAESPYLLIYERVRV